MIIPNKKREENVLYIPIYIEDFVPYTDKNNTSIHHSERDWVNGITVNHIAPDEAPLISLPFNIKVILTIIMITSLLIGSFFKFLLYHYVLITNKKNRSWMHRPINVLIVTSAIIHHVTHVATGIWYVLALMMDTPLADEFGFSHCKVMMMVGAYGLAYLVIGSLGLAVYRVLYIKHEHLVKYIIGEKLLLLMILSISIVMSGLTVFLYLVEDSSHRSALNMCTGLSFAQNQILMEYSINRGAQMLTTTYLQLTSLALLIAIQTMEFSIYIWFFYNRYKDDNGNITKYLRQEDIRNRNLKNIGTFLGQFYGFLVEYSFLISLFMLDYFADEYVQHFRALVVMAKFVDFGLLSAVEIFSSPLLKAHLRKLTKDLTDFIE